MPMLAKSDAQPTADHQSRAHVTTRCEEAFLEIVGLKQTVLRAGRLFAEAILVPTALLTVLLHVVGLMASVGAAVAWCVLASALRWILSREVPGALLMGIVMLSGRAAVAIATSSVFLYVLQPALGSTLMAALFLGSAALGRPITLRLARDFLSLPDHFIDSHGVRRMFTQVALLWGVSRMIDAAMSIGFLHWSVDAGLLARSLISPVLSGLTIAASTAWGIRCLRRNGIKLRLVPHRAHAPAPVAAA
jgi:hypothetical protein